MSALSRFGPSLARSVVAQQQRHMASASQVSEPIQRLFVDKIREFKSTNKGLDEAHKKLLQEELMRLKRVYQVEDEAKLTHLEYKFSGEHNVSLHDIDSSKELRAKIHSGEYQKQLAAQSEQKSELLASIPEQFQDEFHLPMSNKPDLALMHANNMPPNPTLVGEPKKDYEVSDSKITVESLEREMRVHFSDDMPTIHDDKAPGRDAVNYPRIPQLLETPPTRYHVLPESWFRFFYPKTGVSGPYVFATTFGAFLWSKEWLIMDHEMLTAFSSIAIFAYAIPKYGPKVREYFVKEINKEVDGWDHWQKTNTETLGKIIDSCKQTLGSGSAVINEIYDARRQELDLQVEAEYRNRIKTAYEDTKRRLNYLVSIAESQRSVHHANMVSWVLSNVNSSFGPKQETEVLDNCIFNLKELASKNANAI